jgi:hypothetical protein
VSESQSLSQRQSTNQSATATGPGNPPTSWDGPDSFFAWVTAFAQSIGATVQTILQTQEADCLEHCGDEALLQLAEQRAATAQTSSAGDIPEPGSDPPPAGEPPAAADGPPAAAPWAAGTGLAPAAPSAAAAAVAASSETATVQAERAKKTSSGRDSIVSAARGRATIHQSSQLSTQFSGRASGAGSSEAPAPGSGTDVDTSVDTGHSSTASSTSSTSSHLSASSTSTTATPVPLDPRATADDRGNPDVPWLPVALLVVAGLGVIQSLRLRPGFGG